MAAGNLACLKDSKRHNEYYWISCKIELLFTPYDEHIDRRRNKKLA
jgi:hypothetical protein